ncbi:class I SAM-dependent methyltransferase [Pelagicoccus sp. SDUM812003]|nr:class I SAM-dependent methyltransferase [Pelagicoccus sp. SDUM812003]
MLTADAPDLRRRHQKRGCSLNAIFPLTRMTHIADLICDRFSFNERSRVLDLGCSDGDNALTLAMRTGAQVIGVDACSGAVRGAIRASGELEALRCNTQFFVEQPESLPFAENSFDAIYCDRFLDTVSNPRSVVRDLSGMIKPSGSILVADMYFRREPQSMDSELKRWLGGTYDRSIVSDVVLLFEEQGMSLVHFEPLDVHLSNYLESVIMGSTLQSKNPIPGAWGRGLERETASSLLAAVDEREIGYAAMVFEADRKLG